MGVVTNIKATIMSSILKGRLKSISFTKAVAILVLIYVVIISIESFTNRSPLEGRWSGSVFLIDDNGAMKPTNTNMSLILDVRETREIRQGNQTAEVVAAGYQIKFSGEDKDRMLQFGFNEPNVSTSNLLADGACSGVYSKNVRLKRFTPDLKSAAGPILDFHGQEQCQSFQVRADNFSEMVFLGGNGSRVMAVMDREWDMNVLQRAIMFLRWREFRRLNS